MDTDEGVLAGGLPYLAFGSGPPLVVFPGLTTTNDVPHGLDRYFQFRSHRRLAVSRRIWVIARRPSLPAQVTMGDLAADYADALDAAFGPAPLPVIGTSTGGSIALQFAIDHPTRVERLAIVAAGCALSDRGRRLQAQLAGLIMSGQHRMAWQRFGEALVVSTPAKRAVGTALWVLGPTLSPEDPGDMVATIMAEDTFNVCADLDRIAAPTLIVGGTHDELNSAAILTETARLIPRGRLRLIEGAGHARAAGSPETIRAVTEFMLEQSAVKQDSD